MAVKRGWSDGGGVAWTVERQDRLRLRLCAMRCTAKVLCLARSLISYVFCFQKNPYT